jgi:hypothetical protein
LLSPPSFPLSLSFSLQSRLHYVQRLLFQLFFQSRSQLLFQFTLAGQASEICRSVFRIFLGKPMKTAVRGASSALTLLNGRRVASTNGVFGADVNTPSAPRWSRSGYLSGVVNPPGGRSSWPSPSVSRIAFQGLRFWAPAAPKRVLRKDGGRTRGCPSAFCPFCFRPICFLQVR